MKLEWHIQAYPKLVGREPICGVSRKVFEMRFCNYMKIKIIRNGKIKNKKKLEKDKK
jgi:hypothetical protein